MNLKPKLFLSHPTLSLSKISGVHKNKTVFDDQQKQNHSFDFSYFFAVITRIYFLSVYKPLIDAKYAYDLNLKNCTAKLQYRKNLVLRNNYFLTLQSVVCKMVIPIKFRTGFICCAPFSRVIDSCQMNLTTMMLKG